MIARNRWTWLAASMLAGIAVPAAAQSGEGVDARIEALQAQIRSMQQQLDELKAAQAKVQADAARPQTETTKKVEAGAQAKPPAFRAAPEFSADGGWKFKVRGRLMYDVAHVEEVDALGVSTLGFNSRVRRARLGVEGTMPGDFAYKAEFDFANASVGYGDIILTYAPEDRSYSFGFGNFDTFQSLEQPTSSRYISFLERAQMNEAFDHSRRLGAWAGFASGDFRANVGLFNDRIRADNAVSGAGEGSFGNDDLLLAARAVWAPKALGGQLHLGANLQHREFDNDNLALDYRTRPFVQTTDQRFVATGSIAAEGDLTMGVEAAGIFGPLHLTAEAQRVKADALRPGDVLGRGEASGGTRYAGDPVFHSAYLEAGYWLTGETRGYRNGLWDRTRVKRGFDKGGWGALQIVGRVDWLDLEDRVAEGTATTRFGAPNFVNGGTQTGYLLAFNWQPIDYVRFTAQYTRAEIEGGPRAATILPVSGDPVAERDYGLDIFALRAAFDF